MTSAKNLFTLRLWNEQNDEKGTSMGMAVAGRQAGRPSVPSASVSIDTPPHYTRIYILLCILCIMYLKWPKTVSVYFAQIANERTTFFECMQISNNKFNHEWLSTLYHLVVIKSDIYILISWPSLNLTLVAGAGQNFKQSTMPNGWFCLANRACSILVQRQCNSSPSHTLPWPGVL